MPTTEENVKRFEELLSSANNTDAEVEGRIIIKQ